MTYYFGFKPSSELSEMLDDVDALLNNDVGEPYYKLRNKISQQIGQELIDNLLVNLVQLIPNQDRKSSMQRIINTIESATETILGLLLGKDSDEEVLPNVHYLQQETLFSDNEQNIRIGFELSEEQASQILAGFEAVHSDEVDVEKIKNGLEVMTHAVLDHFITRFAATLPLGLIKRKSISVTKLAITKALDIAINKLLPQLRVDAINRLVGFYRPFIIHINDNN